MARSKGKSKGKRWGKGQSSSSNPTTTKHREAAKHRFGKSFLAPSNLTNETLKLHDEGELGSVTGDDDVGSIGGKTFNTFASNWTDCTNVSFKRVTSIVNVKSSMQKEMLAILAAVTDVIKSSGGKETDTEYFAALMMSLETIDKPETMAACLALLGMVMKRVPVVVLKVKFADTAKTLVDILLEQAKADNSLVSVKVMGVLASLLREQEVAVWHEPGTLRMFQDILHFVVHNKPKVRKAAQQAVTSVLTASTMMTLDGAPTHHPAALVTAEFCIQEMDSCLGTTDTTMPTLYVLSLLRHVLGTFPHNSTKSVCEQFLRLMTLKNNHLTTNAMHALHGMFMYGPRPQSLSAALNAQLVTALHDFKPSASDSEPMIAWLSTMQEAICHLRRLDKGLACLHLPRFFQAGVQAWLSEHSQVQEAVTPTLKAVLYRVVQPMEAELANEMSHSFKTVDKLFTHLQAALKFAFHSAWVHVIHVMAVFYEVTGKHCSKFIVTSLPLLADLQDRTDFENKKDLEYAVGIAVRYAGPDAVMEALPLLVRTSDGDDVDLRLSWLLPILANNVRETKLSYFTSYFLPLASVCRQKAAHLKSDGRLTEATTYALIARQLWSLLPGFCTTPTDLCQSFGGIAKMLGQLLNEDVELRSPILSALRLLVSRNLDDEGNRAQLVRYDKNYLPILFNLYTTNCESDTASGIRPATLETIKVYLLIASPQVCRSLFAKLVSKLEDDKTDTFVRNAILALAQAMMPRLEISELQTLYTYCSSVLKLPREKVNQPLVKAAYRLIANLFTETSAECRQFLSESLEGIKKLLLKSVVTAAPSVKAARLRCLNKLLPHLPRGNKAFVNAAVPEAILCMKEPSGTARAAACEFLITVARTIMGWSDENSSDSLKDLVHLLMAGLAGSPVLITASLSAIACICNEFKEEMSSDVMLLAVDNVCLLLRSSSLEVVRTSVTLLKDLLAGKRNWHEPDLVEKIVTSLMAISNQFKMALRVRIREVVTKLVKKFGVDIVRKFVPESYHKSLSNINRTINRKARQRLLGRKGESEGRDGDEAKTGRTDTFDDLLRDSESEEEGDDDDDDKSGKKNKSLPSRKVWIHEGGDKNIVDLLDQPASSQSISATAPMSLLTKPKDINRGFRVAADGRLIVADDEEEETKETEEEPLISNDDIAAVMAGRASKSASKSYERSKRKRPVEDEDGEEQEGPKKYQAGGGGIHRPIAVATKRQQPPPPGAEYKAKKAGGDVKRRGKPDPYAYIPLSAKNNRRKTKVSGLLTSLVKAAKKGARQGKKQKRGARS